MQLDDPLGDGELGGGMARVRAGRWRRLQRFSPAVADRQLGKAIWLALGRERPIILPGAHGDPGAVAGEVGDDVGDQMLERLAQAQRIAHDLGPLRRPLHGEDQAPAEDLLAQVLQDGADDLGEVDGPGEQLQRPRLDHGDLERLLHGLAELTGPLGDAPDEGSNLLRIQMAVL